MSHAVRVLRHHERGGPDRHPHILARADVRIKRFRVLGFWVLGFGSLGFRVLGFMVLRLRLVAVRGLEMWLWG